MMITMTKYRTPFTGSASFRGTTGLFGTPVRVR